MSLEAEFSPERLDANNNLLLHGKGDERFSGKHSFLSGVVLENGYYFQVSNVPSQPPPPQGGHRDTFMHSDFHYADSDPILWPQPLNHDNFYLAAIPTHHPGMDPDYLVLYFHPTRESPMLCFSSNSHFVQIETRYLHDIKRIQEKVEARIADYLKVPEVVQDPHSKRHLVNNRRAYAASFFSRLTNQPMTEPELRRCFVEYRRFTLDVLAAMDWDMIYRPRIEGQHPPASDVDHRMGVFTQDPSMVEACTKAGLPFFYIQDWHNVPHTRVDTLASVRSPEENLIFDEGRVKFPTIFKGKANNPNRLAQIYYNSRHVLHSANIFACNYNPPPPRLNAPRSLNNAERNADTHRGIQIASHPYRSNTISPAQHSNIAASAIVKPMISPLLPHVPSPWVEALKVLKTSDFPHKLPTDRGYVFPPISIFFNEAAGTIKTAMLFRWLQVRDIMLFRVGPSAPPSLACPIPSRVWRGALQLNPSTFAAIRSNHSDSRSAGEKREALAFLESACHSSKAQPDAVCEQPGLWRGNLYASPDNLNGVVVKEILFEINELNFRHELYGLDSRLHTAGQQSGLVSNEVLDRHDHILDCIVPPPLARAFQVIEFTQASQGLAHSDICHRVPQLNHLARLMKDWSPSFTTFEKLDTNATPTTLLEMEAELYKYYVLRFFSYHGRFPTVPRSL
ncbi:hypothetical protein FA13DRAFT_1795910 [Coprinellus micaceus]|uniref:Uncharacterized protein n=1 Tax=Coprinellus micaceus TaxID=71717 RepID=A0A4Y7SWQ6_COPMI|nr:hypothetical protein FA13DRAFT_1795910 [Coprinellus micaceus]